MKRWAGADAEQISKWIDTNADTDADADVDDDDDDDDDYDGLIPGAVDVLNGRQTNTLIYQVARRRVPWKDDDLWLAANTLWDLDIL